MSPSAHESWTLLLDVTALQQAIARAEDHLAPSRWAVVVDARVDALHGDWLRGLLPSDTHWTRIPSGEVHKTLATCQLVWNAWLDAGLDRQAVVLAVGGGMTTDLAAWCAANWKRGLPVVLMPTTLLAMVDAAHGGKTGIDYQGGKNLLGSFWPAAAVWVHPPLLQTLPERELRAGLAEVLKHALLSDPARWAELAQTARTDSLRSLDWAHLLPHSINIKLGIVAQDPTERGPRKLLNLGHTLGHAIESTLLEADPHNNGRAWLHGEAVAAGLVLAADLSRHYAALPESDYEAICTVIERAGFPYLPPDLDLGRVAHYLRHDKKNQADELRFVLLDRIGQGRWDVPITLRAALACVERHL